MEEWEDEVYELIANELRHYDGDWGMGRSQSELRLLLRDWVRDYQESSNSDDYDFSDSLIIELEHYESRHGSWHWELHDPDNHLSPSQHFCWLLNQWRRRPDGPLHSDKHPGADDEIWRQYWLGDERDVPAQPPQFRWQREWQ